MKISPSPFLRSALALLLVSIASRHAAAQTELSAGFPPGSKLYIQPPYAGKDEARIGGSRESADDKLRLDIGASADLLNLSWGRVDGGGIAPELPRRTSAVALGADFFTWTRLRSVGGFKFPVEAVDYYFGLHAEATFDRAPVPDLRLRVAHISAHLVDGDPSFSTAQASYQTYSREFIDLMAAADGTRLARGLFDASRATLRPYAGLLWLTHTIPDTLGRLNPYVGFDAAWQPWESPLTLRLGYEFRLNTELETIGEHEARLGVKLGRYNSKGITIEGSYYAGRSHYGQHFGRRERYVALGFAIDY
ncbi:MAG: hypothetical protein JWQ98_3642 [Chlorobi bacterium]|nr:hypothetical protein [Chlorobiota bacterium]